ncbi:MAG: hypothetical protein HMLKMBBP_03151 [Planctomycetes bacterium]|nr:hypothetical protein [Planctomycetota bacterium]
MKFPARCAAGGPRCGGPAEREYAAGCTSLALLAFLGAGHTHREGEWMPVVARGFDALLRMQRKDGSFATDEKRAYASAIAAAALAEGAGMTASPRLRAAAERAVGYFVARQAETGGWRYDPGDGAADTSVTSWVSLALASARKSGIAVPDATVAGARAWIARVRGDDGSVGYLGRAGGYPSLLGAAMFADVALGGDADARENRATAALLLRHLPRIARDDADGGSSFGAADPMHWYHGSLAAFQAGGAVWERWHERLRPVLLGTQEVSGDARGSYPPSGSSGRHGGRVVTTALCALSLEIYWRYPRATLR